MRIILAHILLLLANLSMAQCWDLRDESVNKVITFYETADFDLIDSVLKKWSTKCEMNEELFRLSILNSIQRNRDLDSLIDNNTIGYIRAYESKKMESFIPYFHAPSFAGSPGSDQLYAMTIQWANSLNAPDSLKAQFLNVYRSDNSRTVWNTLKTSDFPHSGIQYRYNTLVETADEKYVSLNVGSYLHLKSTTLAFEMGLSFDQIQGDIIQSYGGAARFGSKNEIEIDYRTQENVISANSLYLFYDYGKVIRKTKSDYIFFGTIGHSSFLSEYAFEEDRKRLVSVLNLGVGGRLIGKSKRTNRLGVEIRYLPFNFVTNKEVEMNAASLSINIKYLILNSRIAREFLQPIGYYD